MTNIYEFRLLVTDSENNLPEDVIQSIESNKHYGIRVLAAKCAQVKWSDDHPLNKHATQLTFFNALMKDAKELNLDDMS